MIQNRLVNVMSVHDCDKRFDDRRHDLCWTSSAFKKCGIVSVFMGLKFVNEQIAHELSINESDAYQMTTARRGGMVKKKPEVILSNEVECDEASVVAGHKGQPEIVKTKGAKAVAAAKSTSGRGTMEQEKPPVFGMIERGGQVVIHLLGQCEAEDESSHAFKIRLSQDPGVTKAVAIFISGIFARP